MKVKICGITSIEDGIAAAKAGADYLGLVFDRSSKRYINDEKAYEIIKSLKGYPVKLVGVFTDKDFSLVAKRSKDFNLDVVQVLAPSLRSDLDLLSQFEKLIVIPVNSDGSYEIAPFSLQENETWLYDCKTFGEGKTFNWSQFIKKEEGPFFLAGGLKLNNLGLAAETLAPQGLDVSSGVSLGCGVKKDHKLMKEFIKRTHEV